jgi:DNA-binding PadR family transcriptional regulator
MVALSPSPRLAPDYTDRAYWAGTIKMSLSKLFILAVLHRGPMHGYEIARAVERTTRGCCSPTEGTIYPSLRDFEDGGYVTGVESVVAGRRRRVYTLTEKGRRACQVAWEAWLDATKALEETGKAVVAGGRGACCP